jgi:hypothetical protein
MKICNLYRTNHTSGSPTIIYGMSKEDCLQSSRISTLLTTHSENKPQISRKLTRNSVVKTRLRLKSNFMSINSPKKNASKQDSLNARFYLIKLTSRFCRQSMRKCRHLRILIHSLPASWCSNKGGPVPRKIHLARLRTNTLSIRSSTGSSSKMCPQKW